MTGSTESKDRIIKILEMTGEPLGHGGQESFIFNFISGLERHDLKIDVLTPYACENDNWKRIISGWGEIFEFGLKFEPGKSRADIKEPLKAFLMEHKYDVVHIHSGSISVLAFASKIARKSGVEKVIVHSHSKGLKSVKHDVVRLINAPAFCKYPTKLCACSREAGLWKFPRKLVDTRMEVIYNGINQDKFEFSPEKRREICEKYGISDETFVVGHVGRFSYEKNHEFLLQITAELKKRRDDFKVLLLGAGDLFDEIRKKAADLGLSDMMIFAGNTDSIQDYYNAMDIFCLPSIHEGLPISCIEALTSGLPVLVSSTVSDELQSLGKVKILDISDSKVWADEIEKVIMSPKLADREKAEGLSRFGISETVQRLVSIYRD